MFHLISLCLIMMQIQSGGTSPCTNVRDFGARGDGKSIETRAIQAAVDSAASGGGGEVVFPAGVYLSGTLHLRSNISLHFMPGSILKESPNNSDFDPLEKLTYESHADVETTDFHFGLITGENVHNIAISGQGTIDGNRLKRHGPKTIALKNCSEISIRDVHIENSPNYSVSFLGCSYIVVDGITIKNGYADGIDPDCSKYVRISNCFVDANDDAICLKTSLALGKRISTEFVTVTNCILCTECNHFKLGTESSGDFKNIALSNCVMLPRTIVRDRDNDRAAIALESVDGANVDGVTISNCVIRDIYAPIFIRLGNRGRGLNPRIPGTMEHISISDIVSEGSKATASITGIPGHPVKHVSLQNLRMGFIGLSKKTVGDKVPEKEIEYPEAGMFGDLPAYGIYCRHISDLTLNQLKITHIYPDLRPAMITNDVSSLFMTGCIEGTHPLKPFHIPAR